MSRTYKLPVEMIDRSRIQKNVWIHRHQKLASLIVSATDAGGRVAVAADTAPHLFLRSHSLRRTPHRSEILVLKRGRYETFRYIK